MFRRCFVLFCCISAFAFSLGAQAPNTDSKQAQKSVPLCIQAGMDAYKAKGPEEAVRAWIKDSPIDGSKDALTQANFLRQIQDYYGAYQGYEIVSSRNLSSKAQIIYLVVNYEKGPLFGKFVTYKSDAGWILTSFIFNTKEEVIFPPSL